MQKVLNIGHRGFCSKYPENTMLSFKKAYELGIDGIETDVQLTKDGKPVIIHDEELDRTTTGTGLVLDYTHEQLQKLDAGVKFGEQFKGVRIPDLDEFLDYFRNKDLIINLELKNSVIHYEHLEKIVYEKIREYKMEDRIIVSTFNHYSLIKCKQLNPNVKIGMLYWDCIYRPEKYAATLGTVDYLHPEFNSVDSTIISDAHAAGFNVHVYTVDKEEDIRRMASLGVDAIITDCPDIVKRILA